MSQTVPPAVDALPTPPSTSNPTGFDGMADAWVAAQPTFRTQLIALVTNAYNNCVDAFNSAVNAAASAASAAGSASAAATAAGATIWVSGTTYAVGDCRFSPINTATYRRRSGTAGAGTTDPSLDATNWALISYFTPPFLHVREEQASGVSAATSTVGNNVRVLNTVVGANTIAWSALASNGVTLPAGTYDFIAEAPIGPNSGSSNVTRATLYNNTDAVDIAVGPGASYGSNSGSGSMNLPTVTATCSGRFTIAAAKVIKLHQSAATASVPLGQVVGAAGQVEVYASIKLWKVA
jgi:hypothetical protein